MVGQTRGMWLSAVVVLAAAGAAAAQQPPNPAPTRAVYVTAADGKAGVYYVTGVVPPAKLPPSATTPPLAPPAPASLEPIAKPTRTTLLPTSPPAAVPGPAKWVVSQPVPPGAPATLPPVVPAPPPVAVAQPPVAVAQPPEGDVIAGCATGDCRKHGHCGKHGPTSWCVCCKTPATIPDPLGAAVRGAFDMQRDNAMAEYFVLYREDWFGTTTSLNDTGARHIEGIIKRLGMIPAPVKVEPTGNADLDARRRAAVAEELVKAGYPPALAAARVTSGTTRAEGLRGRDIEGIQGRAGSLQNSGYGGLGGFGGGFGGIGSFGGAGFGGFGTGYYR